MNWRCPDTRYQPLHDAIHGRGTDHEYRCFGVRNPNDAPLPGEGCERRFLNAYRANLCYDTPMIDLDAFVFSQQSNRPISLLSVKGTSEHDASGTVEFELHGYRMVADALQARYGFYVPILEVNVDNDGVPTQPPKLLNANDR